MANKNRCRICYSTECGGVSEHNLIRFVYNRSNKKRTGSAYVSTK